MNSVNSILRPGLSLICFVTKRNAGHSKWANIRHIKAEKDGQKSQLYVKLCQRIRVAIQEGGNSNPNANLYLAQAIEVAKKQNMPISSIQNCIKTAQTDASKVKSVVFEIRGPRGCLMMASAFTSNPKKTRDTLTPILKKNGAVFSEHSGKYEFEHKAIIVVKPSKEMQNVSDVIIDHAIECGAEEVTPSDEEDGLYNFICDLNEMAIVKGNLNKLKYEIKSSDFELIPKTKVVLTEEEMIQMSKLLDKLEDHPDIVKVYTNIE